MSVVAVEKNVKITVAPCVRLTLSDRALSLIAKEKAICEAYGQTHGASGTLSLEPNKGVDGGTLRVAQTRVFVRWLWVESEQPLEGNGEPFLPRGWNRLYRLTPPNPDKASLWRSAGFHTPDLRRVGF